MERRRPDRTAQGSESFEKSNDQDHWTRQASKEGEPWEFGNWGKGWVDPEGQLNVWNTTPDGNPHHEDEFLKHWGGSDREGEGYTSPIHVAPDGGYTDSMWLNMGQPPEYNDHRDPTPDDETVQATGLPLRYMKGPDWAAKYWSGGGYGHADKLAANQWYEDPDRAEWQHGLCDAYALAMMEMHPHLRLGVNDQGMHWFTHDDKYAYDSIGRHPLPYYGVDGDFEESDLNQDPADYSAMKDEQGRVMPENGGREDMERAKALIPQQHPWLSTQQQHDGSTRHANELANGSAEGETSHKAESKLTQADIPNGEDVQASGHAILPENSGGLGGRARPDQAGVGGEYPEARQDGISDDQRDVGDGGEHSEDRGKATTSRQADLADPSANGLIHPRDIQGNGTWLCPKGHQQLREPAIGYSSYCEGCKAFIPREHFIYYAGNPALDQVRQSAAIPSMDELAPHRYDRECYEVAHMIAKQWPHLKTDAGYYLHPDGRIGDHGWNIAPDGTIVDMSATQHDYHEPEDEAPDDYEFPSPEHPEIIRPTDPEYERYVSWTRHEPQAQTIAHQRGEHYDGPQEFPACPECNPQVRQAAGIRLDNQVPVDPRLKNQPFLPQDQPPTHCRFCGHLLDAHPGMPGASPNLKCNNTTCLAYGVWVHDNTNVLDSSAGMIQNKLRQAAQPEITNPYQCPGCGADATDLAVNWSGGGYMRCRECGDKWQYEPQSKPVEINQPLYHVAPQHARDQIAQEGLARQTEGVYMDRDPERWKQYIGPNHDVWQINPKGLPIHEGELDGLFTTQDVEPSRLRRLSTPIDLAHGVHESSEDPHVPPMDELMQRAYPPGVPIDHQECYETARALAGKGGYDDAWYPELSYEEGTYRRDNGDRSGHAWVKTPSGTIIDGAHGQFDPQQPVVIVSPDHPEYERYQSDHAQHHD